MFMFLYIVLTGDDNEDAIKDALMKGAMCVLYKPLIDMNFKLIWQHILNGECKCITR